MKTALPQETAERRVVWKYRKLYVNLMELVDALQRIEPGGTLVDDVTITNASEGEVVRLAYAARPVMLTVKDKDRTFILRVVETSDKSEVATHMH